MRCGLCAGRRHRRSDGGRRSTPTQGEYRNDALPDRLGRAFHQAAGIEHAITLCEGISAERILCERILAMDASWSHRTRLRRQSERARQCAAVRCSSCCSTGTLAAALKRRDRIGLTFSMLRQNPAGGWAKGGQIAATTEMGRRRIHIWAQPLRFSLNRGWTPMPVTSRLTRFSSCPASPAPWLGDGELPASPGGFIKADEHCSVEDLRAGFVAGDAGGATRPRLAPEAGPHGGSLQARCGGAEPPLATLASAGFSRAASPIELISASSAPATTPRQCSSAVWRSFMLPSEDRVLRWSKRYC